MGKLTISMVIFNSYVKLPEGTIQDFHAVLLTNMEKANIRQICRYMQICIFPSAFAETIWRWTER
jgi:hypothetical protein